MSGIGTLAKGGFSSTTRRTVWTFSTPAGRTKTLLTYREAEQNPEIERNPMHGDGGEAPYAIATGNGTVSFSGSMAKHEWAEVERLAAGAGLAISELRFDMVTSDVISGMPKDTARVIGCQLESWPDSTATDGTMVEISGQALNKYSNGAWAFKPRK